MDLKILMLTDANTGFDINDVVGKFRVNTNSDAKVYQSLEFFQYSYICAMNHFVPSFCTKI